MSINDFYIGQIKAFGFNFAPQGWAFCDGGLLAISQYDALFTLLGTTYGGDGRTTFGLPDLRGRVQLHLGTGGGLSTRQLGQRGGQERVTLNAQDIPSHKHSVMGSDKEGTSQSPGGNVPATNKSSIYQENADAPFNENMIGNTGGNQSHNNMQPYISINWCIALFGVYPSRN